MAIRWAVANGNWSSTATWDGGTLPGPDDDVYCDTWTVTLDQDITVLNLRADQRSGGTAGGYFNNSLTRVVNANLIAGAGHALSNVGTATLTINGNVRGSDTTAIRYGINQQSTGALVINGNVYGGLVATGMQFSGSATTCTINGNVYGDGVLGINYSSAVGTLTVNGDVYGSGVAGAVGITNLSTGTVMVNGNVYGGAFTAAYGLSNWSTGTLTLNGIAIASDTAEAVHNNSTGTITLAAARHAANGRSPWIGNGRIFFSNLDLAHVTVNNAAHVQRMLGRRLLAPLGIFEGGFHG